MGQERLQMNYVRIRCSYRRLGEVLFTPCSNLYHRNNACCEFVVLEEWENEKSARAHLESDNLTVLVGAGSVLAQKVCVSLANDPSVRLLAGAFKERINGFSDAHDKGN
jgi:hypothetical protein